jgi:hypothetical protein
MRHPSELLYPIGKVICIDVRRCEHYLLEYWLSCARATIPGHKFEGFEQIAVSHRMGDYVYPLGARLLHNDIKEFLKAAYHRADHLGAIRDIAE